MRRALLCITLLVGGPAWADGTPLPLLIAAWQGRMETEALTRAAAQVSPPPTMAERICLARAGFPAEALAVLPTLAGETAPDLATLDCSTVLPTGVAAPASAPTQTPEPAPQPAPTPALQTVETPIATTAANPKALRDYRSDYLRLGSIQTMSVGYIPMGYGAGGMGTTGIVTASNVQVEGVLRGGATMLTPMNFAKLVGDTTTQQKMRSQRSKGTALMSVGGIILIGGSAIALSQLESDSFTPIYVTSVVGGAGLALPGAYLYGRTMKYRPWYTRSRAQARIDAYNEKLRKRLNLSEQDTVEIDTQ